MAISVEDRWLAGIETVEDWAREHTPWSLACISRRSGGCFLQITWQVTPRKGRVLWPGGPAKAMVLVCSGPVTEKQGQDLVSHYASLSEPRFIIVLGTRVLPEADYKLCPDVAVHMADLLPVDLVLVDYPPHPEGAITGMKHLLSSWLIRKRLPAGKHQDLDTLPAEVVQRRIAQAGAPPTQEEMDRDRHLADRPPV